MILIYDMNRTLEGWNLEENILSVMTLKDQTQGPCRSGTAKFGLLRVGSFEPFGRTCSALTLILLYGETRDLECRRISKRIKPSIKSQRPPRSRKNENLLEHSCKVRCWAFMHGTPTYLFSQIY